MTMTLIDREGRFRGTPTAGIIKTSTNGFPQFVVEFQATEYYDETGEFGDAGEWVDWSDYGQTMRAYLVLFNAEKALLNYEQVMKAFNWDGTDFAALQTEDFDGLMIQFEVQMNEYKGTSRLQVNWVDTYDANPVSTLAPMDPNKIKQITAQFGKFMVKGKKAAPAKAGKPKAIKPKAQAKKSTAPPAPAAKAPAGGLPTEVDKGGAWEFLFAKKGDIEDDTLAEAWVAGCEAIGGEADEDEFTDEQWAQVRDHVMDKLEIVPL